jgi:hypothetical protein
MAGRHEVRSLSLPGERLDRIGALCGELGVTRVQLIADALDDLEIGASGSI